MATEMSGEKCSSLQLRSMSLEQLCSSFLAPERSNHGLMDHRRVQSSNLQSHLPILRQKHNMGRLESIVVNEHFIAFCARLWMENYLLIFLYIILIPSVMCDIREYNRISKLCFEFSKSCFGQNGLNF